MYLLNLWMDQVDILPDVRYWSEVLCCAILTHISDLEVKVTDFEILCLHFWLKVNYKGILFYEILMDCVARKKMQKTTSNYLKWFLRYCDLNFYILSH